MSSDLDEEDRDATIISIKGLRLDSVSVPNIWGDIKPQPAFLDISIHLRNSFNSAASLDALDDSTIHYGELAKKIRAACPADEPNVLEAACRAAYSMAKKERTGQFIASLISVELVLPKASAYGSALSLRDITSYDAEGYVCYPKREFTCKGLRIMTLIGVNAYERRGKQPLVVDLSIEQLGESDLGSQVVLKQYARVERDFVGVIEETAFETLESLADHAVAKLIKIFSERGVMAKSVRIRFEKPAAIPFADAPVIEIKRQLP